VTKFFERRVTEHSDQQCHERQAGSKDGNYGEKVPNHGTQHSARSDDYTPHRGCKADGRAKVSLFDALILVNSHQPTYGGLGRTCLAECRRLQKVFAASLSDRSRL
jgi:hypothetical protein